MTIFTILTLTFIVLKLMHYIDWSWWLVLSPSILHATLLVLFVVMAAGKQK